MSSLHNQAAATRPSAGSVSEIEMVRPECHDPARRSYLSAPTQVVINLTNRCNLRCRHCFNGSVASGEQSDELSDSEILNLVHQLKELHLFNVCFSGGEPLLRKDLLLQSAKMLASVGTRISVTSNGTLLDAKTASELVEVGVQDVEISLDGATPGVHERLRLVNGCFDLALQGLRNLRQAAMPLYEVSMTLTSFGIADIEPLARLIQETCKLLILRPILPVRRAAKCFSELRPTPAQYRRAWDVVNRLAGRLGYPEIWFLDPLSGVLQLSRGAPQFGLEIRADGSLAVSPYLPIYLGNVRKHTIKEYWDAGWPYAGLLADTYPYVHNILSDTDLLACSQWPASLKHLDLVEVSCKYFETCITMSRSLSATLVPKPVPL